MRAATRERMIRERMTRITALVLVISIGFLVPKAAAQSDKYPKMAPGDQYLMERRPPSSRGILSSPLLALSHDFVYIRNRAYLNRSKSILKAWKL